MVTKRNYYVSKAVRQRTIDYFNPPKNDPATRGKLRIEENQIEQEIRRRATKYELEKARLTQQYQADILPLVIRRDDIHRFLNIESKGYPK